MGWITLGGMAQIAEAWREQVRRLLGNRLQNSLLLRLGGMFVAITVLAVASMSTSWMVAETTQGSGQAINLAGSLRMQSWRMASIHQRLLQDGTPELRASLGEAIGRFERITASLIGGRLSPER